MATPQRTDALMRALAALRPHGWARILEELDHDIMQLLRDAEAADTWPPLPRRHTFLGVALPQNWIQLVMEDRWPQVEVDVQSQPSAGLQIVVLRLRSLVIRPDQ